MAGAETQNGASREVLTSQRFQKFLCFGLEISDVSRPVGLIAERDRGRARLIGIFLAPDGTIRRNDPAALLADQGKYLALNHRPVAVWYQSSAPRPSRGS